LGKPPVVAGSALPGRTDAQVVSQHGGRKETVQEGASPKKTETSRVNQRTPDTEHVLNPSTGRAPGHGLQRQDAAGSPESGGQSVASQDSQGGPVLASDPEGASVVPSVSEESPDVPLDPASEESPVVPSESEDASVVSSGYEEAAVRSSHTEDQSNVSSESPALQQLSDDSAGLSRVQHTRDMQHVDTQNLEFAQHASTGR